MKLLSFLLIVIFLVSCSKKNGELNYEKKIINNVENVINENRPLYNEFKLDTLLITFVDGGDDSLDNSEKNLIKNIADISIDSKGDVFILDGRESKIHKYDKNGKFITRFGRKGNGPGEFIHCYSMMLKNDTIYIPNKRDGKIIVFDLEGNFVRNISPENSEIPHKLSSFGDNFLGSRRGIVFVDGKGMNENNLKIYDKNLQVLKTVYNYDEFRDYSKPFNPTDDFVSFANTDSSIFVALNSEDKYQVAVYDKKGELQQVIKKKFRKIPMTAQEVKDLKKSFHYNINVNGKEVDIKFKAKFKKAIVTMAADKYDRVWIYPAMSQKDKEKEDSGFYEVFKDGVFLAKAKIGSNILFKNGKIVIYNYYKSQVSVYDY